MSGLRERQKDKRAKAIVSAAKKLFIKKGFNAVKMEEIAERAEVGVGTVYNYFGSKNDLLLAVFQADTTQVIELGRKRVLDSDIVDPVESVSELLFLYVEGFSKYSKEFMSEIAVAIFNQFGAMGHRMMDLDFQLMGQLTVLLQKLRENGRLDQGISLQEAAFTLYSVWSIQYMFFIFMAEMSLDDFGDSLKRQVQIVFDGLGVKKPQARGGSKKANPSRKPGAGK